MAETIISPGVFARENDISFITPAPAAVGAAIIGPTVKGPVEIPTLVTSYNDYSRKFGLTFESGSTKQEFLTSIAVKNYFDQGGESVLVTRVVSGSFTEAQNTVIYSSIDESGVLDLDTLTVDTNTADGVDNTYSNVPLTGSLSGTGGLATVVVSSNAVTTVTVTDGGSGYAVGEVLTIFSGSIGGTTNVTTTALVADDIVNKSPFTIKTIGKGTIYNSISTENTDGSLPSGSEDNLRWEISNVDNAKGTFTLSVRRGDDNRNNKIILETFNNLSLDPNSPNYIAAAIGDQSVNLTGGDLITTGDYTNKSKFIYVSSVNTKTYDYIGNDGQIRVASASGSLPTAGSGSFQGATGAIVSTVDSNNNYFGDIAAGTQGLVGDNYSDVITLLGNKDEFQFNIISAPGLLHDVHGTTVDSIVSLAESRGDCIAVVDLVAYGTNTISTVTSEAGELNSSYAASYWPWLQMSSATGKLVWVPASVVIPGVYAFTDNSSAPWFAPAGLVRGGLAGVLQAKKKLTRSDRDSLYNGKVNPIATFPGSGISVFGQKTLQTKSSALDRVNVRRLLIELKEFLGNQARNLVFEQNTIATRNRFLASVNPYLESVVQQQGLYTYRVVMDDSNNTADVVDRNQLVGQIFIQPAKTAEFIVLDFVVEPTGATFDA